MTAPVDGQCAEGLEGHHPLQHRRHAARLVLRDEELHTVLEQVRCNVRQVHYYS